MGEQAAVTVIAHNQSDAESTRKEYPNIIGHGDDGVRGLAAGVGHQSPMIVRVYPDVKEAHEINWLENKKGNRCGATVKRLQGLPVEFSVMDYS